MPRDDAAQFLENEDGHTCRQGRMLPGAHEQSGIDLRPDSAREIRRSCVVHGHCNHSTQRASQEDRNPLRTVLAP